MTRYRSAETVHLRDRSPGHLGVATETAAERNDATANATPGPRVGSRRSLPSILSVGHDRQPTGCPAELPALRQKPNGILTVRPRVLAFGGRPATVVSMWPPRRDDLPEEMTCQRRTTACDVRERRTQTASTARAGYAPLSREGGSSETIRPLRTTGTGARTTSVFPPPWPPGVLSPETAQFQRRIAEAVPIL
jgi:hypothetical protein